MRTIESPRTVSAIKIQAIFRGRKSRLAESSEKYPVYTMLDVYPQYFNTDTAKSVIERKAAISSIRGTDHVFIPHQGLIYDRFIESSKECINALFEKIKELDIHILFSLERGGSLLGDQIVSIAKKEKYELGSIKIERVETVGEPYSKTEHVNRMLDNIFERLRIYKDRIAITETFIGGGSINGILEVLKQRTDISKQAVKEKLFFILEHQTILDDANDRVGIYTYFEYLSKKNEASPEVVRTSEKGKKKKGKHPKPIQAIENYMLQDNIFVYNTPYIIGEDVDFQINYTSMLPIEIFDGKSEEVLSISPSSNEKTRDLIIKLTTGNFDAQIKKYRER